MELNWDNSFSIGVDSIDDENKEIINKVNLFASSMKKGKEEAIKALELLEKEVIQHFEKEEQIQKEKNYPKSDMQHKQHEVFKTELKHLRQVFENTGVSSLFVINTQQKVMKWWEIHLSVLDKEWGKFLAENSK